MWDPSRSPLVYSPGPDRTPTNPSSPSPRRRSTNTRAAWLSFDRLTFHCELNNFQNAQELSLVKVQSTHSVRQDYQSHICVIIIIIIKVIQDLKEWDLSTPLVLPLYLFWICLIPNEYLYSSDLPYATSDTLPA